MAMTHDYLDFLNEKVVISPANSEEELQAAQTIAGLMGQHVENPTIEEFDTPALAGLVPSILSLLMLVGIILAGTGVIVLAIIGLVLAAIPAILFLLGHFGYHPRLAFGPTVRSQNVIAKHNAEGPLVSKGNRRIMVIAHYDTPRENILYASGLAPRVPVLSKASRWCGVGIAVCALVQLLLFLPLPVRTALWIVGILACAPAVILAVGAFSERFTSCTEGANDNKSGVAALLGVMENVSPSGLTPIDRTPKPVATQESEAAEATVGCRHGEEVLRELNILPEDCEIRYMQKEPTRDPAATQTFSALVMDDVPRSFGEKESSGLTLLGDDDFVSSDSALAARPEAPDDPDWGKATYRPEPQASGVARRASLFDLPDPSSTGASDPLATDPNAKRTTQEQASAAASADAAVVAPLPLETIGANTPTKKQGLFSKLFGHGDKTVDAPAGTTTEDDPLWRGGATTRGGLRLVDEDEGVLAEDVSAEDVSDDGAPADEALTEDASTGDISTADAPAKEDLVKSVLTLGDDALIAHDIWFVALGGSAFDHAGIRDFLANHRSEVRGSFVINLDCVGAGKLSVLTQEGLDNTRRVDRRISRLLAAVSGDLHAPLAQAAYDWNSTDATVAMQASMRAATIMGVDENGLPALSHTSKDVAAGVSGEQASLVAEVVTELIRRS